MDPKGRILKETPRFSYEDMMAIVEPGERVIHGYRVKTNSLRYRTFKKQRVCVLWYQREFFPASQEQSV